ncbi:MFS transporter, partial [Candidatus Bathyarchaeota archaeon]|nr:MFS transporter [Candidatus Bathyarchaeota archaeon]
MFINVPIGIVSALLCQRTLPAGGGWVQNRHLDVPGTLTVTSGIILLIYGLTNAAGIGFVSALTYTPLIASVLVLGLFLLIESRSENPLMPLSFIRRGSILTANFLALVLTSVVGGVGFIIPVYFQNILGYSALNSGLLTLPAAIILFVVGGFVASRLVNRYGAKKILLLSYGLVTIGVLLLIPMSPNGNAFLLFPGLIVWAFGASIGFPAINIAAVAGTKPGEEGLASGIVSTSSRIGFPVGLAVLLTVAGAFDPPSSAAGIVAGFQVAILAASLIGVLGFLIATRLKDVKPSWASGASGDWKPNAPTQSTTETGTGAR